MLERRPGTLGRCPGTLGRFLEPRERYLGT
jgi:hypothetical protein